MKTIVIKSPLGYVKQKSLPFQPKAMVLTASSAASSAFNEKESRFYSTGELFSVSHKMKAGAVVAIRVDNENRKSSEWEENSITIPLKEIEKFIQGLQAIVREIHKHADRIKRR